MITLGQKVRDRITGFTGIATAKVVYLNGCVQFCIKPEMIEPGKMPDGVYIDDGQLEAIDDGLTVEKESDGGPMEDTPSDRYSG